MSTDVHASGLGLGAQPVVTVTDDTGVAAPVPVEAQSSFRPFTIDSYLRLLEREEEQAKLEVEKIPEQFQEGRLVDGELKFGDEGADEEKVERDPDLVEGSGVPDRLGVVPLELYGKPLEEIDPYLQEKTFVVITKRFKKKYIHRFSATKSCFLLSPWNPLRRAAVMVYTNQFFDYFIITTILINCVFLALPEYSFKETAEYVFLAIYSVEAVVKITARGFVFYKYTYLRDYWNWLDFIVIITAYLTLSIELATGSKDAIGNISGLRTFRVLRALRTVSIIPGLKTIIGALLKSLRMLADVILLTFFCMMIFALFAIQVYIGVLRQKCVQNPVVKMSDSEYLEYVKNPVRWLTNDDGEYVICGNATGSGYCPANYTCLSNLGENPNFGYTNFDNFGWAMLNSFQLITLDFWEDVYNKVIRANGPWNIVFFIIVVFFGSFYLINLMLAVVSMSYEEEATTAGKEKERERKKHHSPILEMDAEKLRQLTALKLAKRRKKDGSRPSSRHSSRRSNRSNHSSRSHTSQNTHLQVLSAVNGSATVSSTSLQSVGNGVGRMSSIGGVIDESRFSGSLHADSLSTERPVDSAKTNELSHTKPRSPVEPEITSIVVVGFNPSASIGSTDSAGRAIHPGGEAGLLGAPTVITAESENTTGNPSDDDMDSYSSDDSEEHGVTVVKGNWSSESEEDYDDDELIDRNCDCCARCCVPFMRWLRLQNVLYKIVSDFMFEIFITICIVLNVITMSIDHYGMSEGLATGLRYANYVYTAIFTLEAIVKLMAMTKHYFKTSWNVFDFIIVIASLIDLGLEDVDGLSVLRGFRLLRLLRVFKLAQTWSTMRVLLSIILKTLSALGNLTFILGIVIYIFAVIGMQLFSKTYLAEKFEPDEIPRWNFSEFFHSLMLIFRILCGEWIEPLWDCMRANGEICMIVFLPTLVFGNFMVLNLFLALLLNSFASDKLDENKEVRDKSKVKQGWERLKSIFKNKRIQVQPSSEEAHNRQASIANILDELKGRHGEKPSDETVVTMTTEEAWAEPKNRRNSAEMDKPGQDLKTPSPLKKAVMNTLSVPSLGSLAAPDSTTVKEKDADKDKKSEDSPDHEDTEAEADAKKVEDCFPACCCVKCTPWMLSMDASSWGVNWHSIRVHTHRVTEHKVFEYFILVIIFLSSVSLCFEDIYLDEKPVLKKILYYLNIFYAVIFTAEMLIKWVGLGFSKYFTSFWTVLDFFIVVISLLTLLAESIGADQLSSFRSLRTLRALRPLRAISRWQGMRIVVNALVYAIPSIFNVLLVCLIFWLIFSIAGVQLFGGKFFKCVDDQGNKLSHTIVSNKTECMANSNYTWINSKINFDNVLNGYLALFQVATFEGWMEVMEDASDAAGLDKQPVRETNFHSHWYFVIFIICGSFFTLNLFIGVIIDNFNMLKKKYEGGALDMFLTAHQRDYYNTMKKIGMRKPQKTIKRPKNKIQAFFFDVSVNTKFELAVVLLIICNMISMAVEHYRQTEVYTEALDIVNVVFISIFTLEAVVKIIGMRWHYFRRGWNIFDFIVVIISILGIVLDDILSSVIITPTLLRVVRVFRIGRVLRLIKAAKGLRKLLFALVISLPALLNIGMLLFLIVFIYAIFGMTSFGHVRHTGTLDDVVNFQTFGSSLVLLFRLTTSAGWNDILDPLMVSGAQCDSNYWTHPNGTKLKATNGDCGSSGIAVFFMVSFILIAFLIIINMYIAVILENFNQAHQQEEVGVTEDDFDMFYVIWEKYDPHASQFLKYEQLSDFICDLDEPLGLPKPNELAIVALDLPIYADERLHCLDILMALVKHVLGSVDETDEFRKLRAQMEEKYLEAFPTRVHHVVLSTTMQRKKEDVAAKTLQRAWRKHKTMKNILLITEMALKKERRNSLMPSRQSSSASLSASVSPPRPPATLQRQDSMSNTKTLKASDIARKKRQQAGLMLNLPTAGDIGLPSDDKDV